MSKIQSVTGMNDLLPENSYLWQQVEAILREVAGQYGYGELRTPILERTELFQQSIGDQTDIVEKEMYTFKDSGEVSVTMRPEATASTVRACNQHGLLYNQQQRLWYMGPMFRRERPQKGRYRQFHQFGIEAFGWSGPDIDAEILQVGDRLWKRLGVQDIKLEINTLGSDDIRARYKQALTSYLEKYFDDLDEDSQRRLSKNPLRILDSKNQKTQEIVQEAPELMDFLDGDARAHFDGLQGLLSDADIDFKVSSRLVRGLDYYTSTVFEWTTDKLGAQSAVCAGGRYDNLVGQRGGHASPAIGFAMGVERLIELVKLGGDFESLPTNHVYMIPLSQNQTAATNRCAERLRNAGLNVVCHRGGGKLKSQMKKADQSGAEIAVLIGEEEQQTDRATVKLLRTTRTGEQTNQESVSQETLVEYCLNILS